MVLFNTALLNVQASSFIYVHLIMQPDSHLFSYPAGFKPLTLWCVLAVAYFIGQTLKEGKVAPVSHVRWYWVICFSFYIPRWRMKVSLSYSPDSSFKQVCCKGWAPVSLTSFTCQGYNLRETHEAETVRVLHSLLLNIKCGWKDSLLLNVLSRSNKSSSLNDRIHCLSMPLKTTHNEHFLYQSSDRRNYAT